MIEINLLPQESAARTTTIKSASESTGALQTVGILVACYAVLLVASFLVYNYRASEVQKVSSLEADSARLKKEISQKEEDFQELNEALAVARNQLALLRALDPEKRLFWAQQINILPKFVPDGVYLTDLTVTEKVVEIETRESREAQDEWNRNKAKKSGPPPPIVKQPIISQQFIIGGVSYVQEGTSDERLLLIVNLINRLRSEKVPTPFSGQPTAFLEFFKPVVPYSNIKEIKLAERDVTQFKLTLDTIPIDVAAAVDAASPKTSKPKAKAAAKPAPAAEPAKK